MKARPTRREVLAGAGVLAVAGATTAIAGCSSGSTGTAAAPPRPDDVIPFYGRHQAGIVTPPQERLFFASFDLLTDDRVALRALLRGWSQAAPLLTAGRPAGDIAPSNAAAAPGDTGEAAELPASRLTITVGLGRSVFVDGRGRDRLGLAHAMPEALVDMPSFSGGEVLDPTRSDGDIALQCCANDATVAFHAFRNLARRAREFATVRWTQAGFGPAAATGVQATPRNLQGFKDGTNNLDVDDAALMRRHVWVDPDDGPAWMGDGTYMVTRRIRMRIEHWDRSALSDQEETIGRYKLSGAPFGAHNEHDTPRLDAKDADGRHVIPDHAHVRIAAPATNDGVRLLRRGYNFGDGITADTGELDAGLFFIAFQRDPRKQFIPLQRHLADKDALNVYIIHETSGLFAVLPGVSEGRELGHALLT
jgi:deferrochelatase/peroxidase EfeB